VAPAKARFLSVFASERTAREAQQLKIAAEEEVSRQAALKFAAEEEATRERTLKALAEERLRAAQEAATAAQAAMDDRRRRYNIERERTVRRVPFHRGTRRPGKKSSWTNWGGTAGTWQCCGQRFGDGCPGLFRLEYTMPAWQ
jgi:hypothetical protein